jgi:hypothetical protein
MNIFSDSTLDDDRRRAALYNGSIFLYSTCPSALKLCEFAREMLEEAFRPFDPLKVQDNLTVEKCVEILAALKPSFIHHPRSKECIQGILRELDCDPAKTYFDVPRLRTAFPGDYLSSGIAYAFHPHRDTWYSAPFCQVNWWMPVYELHPDNSMAFHPRYWSEAVRNSSDGYNYYEWNKMNRKSAAQHIKKDTRVQPHALDSLELDPQLRFLPKVGGMILFSAAQLHSTVPNTCGLTRYSIDFRTVHVEDVWQRRGAKNYDSACTGTTMHDYLRASDLGHIPEDAIALYADGTEREFCASPSAAADLLKT